MVTLYIDADACPTTREAIDVARAQGILVVIAGNSTQNLERHIRPNDPRKPEDARGGFWVDTMGVAVGADSADFAIISQLERHDVVVTQDIGLADVVLGRGAYAIDPRGRIYNPLTIDSMMYIRHEEKRARRQGKRTRGPRPLEGADRSRLTRNLRSLIRDAKAAEHDEADSSRETN